MPAKFIRVLLPALALSAGALAAACGTVATPEWAAGVQETNVALAATSDHLTAIAPTATLTPTLTSTPTATPVPPTATPIPPTATSLPPTATSIPPTAAPTVAATQQAASAGGSGLSDADAIATASAIGNVANGMAIFNATHQTDKGPWACATCHSVTSDQLRKIGPGLWNLVAVAGSYVPGENAVEYIHQSIVDPQAFIAPGTPPYPQNLMPQNWGTVLSPQDLNDVIAYLLSLH